LDNLIFSRNFGATKKRLGHAARDVASANTMRKARVVSARENQACESELLYIPKPLENGAIDNIGLDLANADRPVNRVGYSTIIERPDRNTPPWAIAV
jgi:hypothetical protein